MAKELRIEIIVDAATGTATLKQFDKTLGDVEKKAGGPVNDALTKLDKTTQGLGGSMSKLGGYLAGFFTVTAVLGAIRGASQFADTLVKLSDKTGIEIEALQRLKATAENSGNSLEQVAQGVAMMSARIGKGGEETAAALTRIGLSAERLKAMKPEEQFVEIARALATVTTQADRDALGMAILGRSYLELKPTLKAAKDGLDEVSVVATEQIEAFDRLGDAVMQFYEQRIKGGLAQELGKLTLAFERNNKEIGLWARGEAVEAIAVFMELDVQAAKVVDRLGLVARAQRDLSERGFKPTALSAKELAGIEDTLTASAERQMEATKRQTDAQKKAADAVREMWASIQAMNAEPTWRKINDAIEETPPLLAKVSDELDGLPPLLARINNSTEAVVAQMTLLDNVPQWQKIAESIREVPPLLAEVGEAVEGVPPMLKKAGAAGAQSWAAGFLDIARGFPDLVVSALTGGGGMSGLFRALGSQVGSLFGTMLGSSLAKSIGGLFGKTLGAILPGIGAMLGPALEWVSGKLFKTEGKKVNDLRDAYVAAAGGIAELDRRAKAAGTTLDALLKAKTVKDYEAAVASLNTKLERTAQLQGELAGLQAQLADRQVMDWQRAEEVIAKYGGSVETLGQQFVAAKQASSWKEVWDDWQTLIDMGADVGGVLVTMKDEIGKLVAESVRIGTEIPAQFKPLIEELIRTGQLFDENGQAIDDIGKLKFGEALVSEVDKIIAKIDELIEALTGHLLPAIGQIPTDLTVRVGYRYEEYEPGGYTGGDVAHAGAYVENGRLARYHAGGVARGLVPRYHLGADEVPAILQAGEGVLSKHIGMPAIGGRTALRALNTGQVRLGAAAGGGSGDVIAAIAALSASMRDLAKRPVITYLDGQKVSRNQMRYLPGSLAKAGL